MIKNCCSNVLQLSRYKIKDLLEKRIFKERLMILGISYIFDDIKKEFNDLNLIIFERYFVEGLYSDSKKS